MKKAVIYTRTARPDLASNEKQKSLCLNFARQNGYEIVRIYTDNGSPGTNAKRPAFRELINNRKSSDWDIVLISDCSRFFRKPRSFIKYIKALRRAGKELISVRDGVFGEFASLLPPHTHN